MNRYTPLLHRIAEGLGLLVLLGAIIAIAHGCSSPQEAAKTALDVSDAICDALPVQSEPDWLTFTCTIVDAVHGTHATFQARIKKESAPVFEARHCHQDAPPSP